MLIDNKNGTYTAGQADIIVILHLPSGTFHPAFFEEHPLPGQTKPIIEESFLRLKSKMHHTQGALTLEGAQKLLDEMRDKIILPDANVIRDKAIDVMEPVNTWILPNWIKNNKTVGDYI